MLVISGGATDVKDHAHWVYLAYDLLPGLTKLFTAGGIVSLQQRLGKGFAVRQHSLVKRQSEKFGET